MIRYCDLCSWSKDTTPSGVGRHKRAAHNIVGESSTAKRYQKRTGFVAKKLLVIGTEARDLDRGEQERLRKRILGYEIHQWSAEFAVSPKRILLALEQIARRKFMMDPVLERIALTATLDPEDGYKESSENIPR